MSLINRAFLLALGLCVAGGALAATKPTDTAVEVVRPAPASVGEQQIPTNKEELGAVDTARAALAKALYVQPDTLPVLSIEQRSWPNSGLGCASPDTATIRIPRKGYAIRLATPDGVRTVHVSGRSSRICDPKLNAGSELPQQAEAMETLPPSYDLKAVVERSREDLARRLKQPLNSVRLVSFAAATWPDNTMDCAVPYEQTRKKTVKGYRIQLRQGERNYIYHTDLVRTRACPSIEAPTGSKAAQNYEVAPPKTTTAVRPAPAKRVASSKAPKAAQSFGVIPRYPSP